MEKVLLNSLKKQEPLNDIRLVVGNRGNKPLYKISYIYIQKIIPNRIIMDKNAYEITHIDEMYHLAGFEVCTENDKVHNVRLYGYHPNSHPDTDIYCLPDFKLSVEFTPEFLSMLLTNIKTYYIDNCFINPLGKNVRYKKMKSMYIQLNQ